MDVFKLDADGTLKRLFDGRFLLRRDVFLLDVRHGEAIGLDTSGPGALGQLFLFFNEIADHLAVFFDLPARFLGVEFIGADGCLVEAVARFAVVRVDEQDIVVNIDGDTVSLGFEIARGVGEQLPDAFPFDLFGGALGHFLVGADLFGVKDLEGGRFPGHGAGSSEFHLGLALFPECDGILEFRVEGQSAVKLSKGFAIEVALVEGHAAPETLFGLRNVRTGVTGFGQGHFGIFYRGGGLRRRRVLRRDGQHRHQDGQAAAPDACEQTCTHCGVSLPLFTGTIAKSAHSSQPLICVRVIAWSASAAPRSGRRR